jgi:hypothetical protein
MSADGSQEAEEECALEEEKSGDAWQWSKMIDVSSARSRRRRKVHLAADRANR